HRARGRPRRRVRQRLRLRPGVPAAPGPVAGGLATRAGKGRRAMSVTRGGLLPALLLLAASLTGAAGQEPIQLDGTWVGSWWMGKYEEPIEMELVQRGALVSGRVAMQGYPGAGDPSGDAASIESGRLAGDRLELVWPMGGKRFTATLTP